MNLQNRYQNCLSDMITLLQQAVYRFITDLQVDLSKFFQYFKQFHRNLVSLESNFHQSKSKFSKYLSKLYTLTQQVDFKLKEKTISLEPQEKTFSKVFKSKSINAETISKKSNHADKTQQLNVIGQTQERQDFQDLRLNSNDGMFSQNQRDFKQRGGTAHGLRQKMSVTIDVHNSRPYTGSYTRERIGKSTQKIFNQSTKQRYKSLTKYQKTINESLENGYPQQPSQAITQKKIFNLGQRKSIYDVLQEEKRSCKNMQGDDQFFKEELIKLPQKRKSKNWSRWSFKINKLL